MEEINLNEILHKKLNQHKADGHSINNLQWCIDAMKDACEKSIDLSAKNAQLTWEIIDYNEKTYWIDKESILNTKRQIK